MRADALGRPLRFIVTPGQTSDVTQAPALLNGQQNDAVLADQAYDSKAVRAVVADTGAEAVIPSSRFRKVAIPRRLQNAQPHRAVLRRAQTLPRFAARYDRCNIHFAGVAHLAAP